MKNYCERHWASAAIALVGLFVFGYFCESFRQILGSDMLLMAFTLLSLVCLGQLGNYLGAKISGSKST
jgi:hypothetical protein